MKQVILHTTHSLKQCETITHSFLRFIILLDKLNASGKIMWHLTENLDECAADANKE